METVLGVIVILFVILLYAALARAACVAGKVAGAFVELVLGEAEKRRPQQYKVKRNYTIVFPLNCPGRGVLMADDFWGGMEWDNFARQMKRVFPEPFNPPQPKGTRLVLEKLRPSQ